MHKHKQKGNRFQYQPAVVLSNTDRQYMSAVREILVENGFPHHICVRDQLGFGTKPIYQIQIQGYKRCKKIIPHILPFMRGAKKRKAEVIMRFIDYRADKHTRDSYGEAERKMWEEFHRNQAPDITESPETIRRDGLLAPYDIVRSNVKALEAGRNDQPAAHAVVTTR